MAATQRKEAMTRLGHGSGPNDGTDPRCSADVNRNDDGLLVLGTGAFIGEGFDCPQLDTLFLAAPISFKGRLVQYAGRITRPYPGKALATVHDYHDELTPVLASSLNKRVPGYRSLGFRDPRW